MPSATIEAAGAAISRDDGAPGRARHAAAWVLLVCLFGVVLTTAFAYRVAHKPGVYLAQVNVLFLPPRSANVPNSLLGSSGGLSSVAGTVGKLVDPTAATSHVVSPDVSLANQGIRHGYSVSLPNDGGQWTDNFDRPLLNVQAVGSSSDEVRRTAQRLVHQIEVDLKSLQDGSAVAAVDRVHTSLNPSGIQVYYLTGSKGRAVAATLGLGCALTAAAAGLLRGLLKRRG